MVDLSVKAAAKASVLEYHVDDYGAAQFHFVAVRRNMHLNPPLGDPVKLYKKSVSWWNISTQETRAEAIVELERRLGRPLSLAEYGTLESKTMQSDRGVVTYVSIRTEGKSE